ncbi:MAG: response regulator [Alphaproteobacteria bacterium]|uniref:response regulator n=1 Tax=Nisaea sp. TaxID=2024842 RepID=UPI00326303A3
MDASNQTVPPVHRHQILVVDDEPDVRTFIADVAEDIGHDVIQASSLTEVAAQLKISLPDLIVLDLVMPDRDGINCLEFLARDEVTAHIPIIMISGFDKDMLSIARNLGAVLGLNMIGEMNKPFSADELTTCLMRIFDGRTFRDHDRSVDACMQGAAK